MSMPETAAKGPKVEIDPAQQADQMTEEGAPAVPPRDPADALMAAVTELRREREDLYDRLLRKTADFDNYR